MAFKQKVQNLFERGVFQIDKGLTNMAANPLPDHIEPRINALITKEERQFKDLLIITTDCKVDHSNLSVHKCGSQNYE